VVVLQPCKDFMEGEYMIMMAKTVLFLICDFSMTTGNLFTFINLVNQVEGHSVLWLISQNRVCLIGCLDSSSRENFHEYQCNWKWYSLYQKIVKMFYDKHRFDSYLGNNYPITYTSFLCSHFICNLYQISKLSKKLYSGM
jgi:hypothetical protein